MVTPQTNAIHHKVVIWKETSDGDWKFYTLNQKVEQDCTSYLKSLEVQSKGRMYRVKERPLADKFAFK